MKNILISSALIILGGLFFVINDGIINFLSPKGIQFYHFVFYGTPTYLLLLLYLILKGDLKKELKTTNYFIPLFRGLLFAPMPFITFLALRNISLPEYTTLNMSSPFIASIFAIFFLKEKINILLFIAILFGLMGVLFVVQPGFDNFNIFYLLVLFGALIITGTTVIVNKYNNVTGPIGYFIYGGIFTHLLSFIFFIFDPLLFDFKTLCLIIISSIFINAALLCTGISFQRSQKYYASIFCLVYIQILWSVLVGYYIFNEYLNFYAIIGAFFIVISGLFSIPSQQKQINAK
jgi:drug/metabolite transporter (DMT)-like permease